MFAPLWDWRLWLVCVAFGYATGMAIQPGFWSRLREHAGYESDRIDLSRSYGFCELLASILMFVVFDAAFHPDLSFLRFRNGFAVGVVVVCGARVLLFADRMHSASRPVVESFTILVG
jgi:hypothetical protein